MLLHRLLTLFGVFVLAVGSLSFSGAAYSQEGRADPQEDRLVLLGTQGGPVPSPARSGIANLLVVDGTPYLIDSGEGVVRRLVTAGFAPAQMRTIFITHHHVDHQADLPSLISLSWFRTALSNQDLEPVQIIGPPATQFALEAVLDYLSVSERTFGQFGSLQSSKTMFEATEILNDDFVFDDGNVRVKAVENTHYRKPSVGPGGVKDRSLSYRFDMPSGSVVFTGDTGPSEALEELAQGANVLVSEISMQFIDPPLPEAADIPVDPELMERMRWHHTMQHLTPEAVGNLATKAGVETLVLTHLVPGGQSSDPSRYAAEVGKYFSGEILVGEDLMSISLGD